MGGHDKKVGKGRRDKYYHLAKGTGYRARSAFKLIQLNKKFQFLESATICIDLCAAPGGWMQVAKRMMKTASPMIIGVDLVPIAPIHGCIGIQADITTEHCRQELRKHMQRAKADCVLHDGAPNVGAAWLQDAFTQSDLVLKSLKLATEFLKPEGVFVTKVFRSRDTWKLMYVFKQLFKRVKATKPDSSRDVSAEIFVVCQGYLAPHHIDPKMLDLRYVFSDVAEEAKTVDVFNEKIGKKKKAEGYEEGNYLLTKVVPAEEFVNSNNFLEMLSEYSSFTFRPQSLLLRLPDTTEEVKALCADLKVLNKKDFKVLVKWRAKVRKFLELADKDRANAAEDGSGGDENGGKVDENDKDGDEDEDEDDGLSKALKEAAALEKAKRKREKRKRDKFNAKLRENISLQIDAPSLETSIDNSALFNLRTIKSKRNLEAVEESDFHVDPHVLRMEAERKKELKQQKKLEKQKSQQRAAPGKTDAPASDSDSDADEDYMDIMEAQLEDQYEKYLERKKIKIRRVRYGGKSTIITGDLSNNGHASIMAERTGDVKRRELAAAQDERKREFELKGKKGKNKPLKRKGVASATTEDDGVDADDGRDTALVRSHKTGGSASSQWFSSQGITDADIEDDLDLDSDADSDADGDVLNGQEDDEDKKDVSEGAGVANQGTSSSNSTSSGNNIRNAREALLARIRSGEDEEWARRLGLQIHEEDLIGSSGEDDDEDDDDEDSDVDSSDSDSDDVGVRRQRKRKEKGKNSGVAEKKGQKDSSASSATSTSTSTKKTPSALGHLQSAVHDAAQQILHTATSDDEEWDGDESGDEGGKKHGKKGSQKKGKESGKRGADERDNVFEEVPIDQPLKQAKGLDATGLAIATQMIVNRKKREIIDKSYHKFAHVDDELPLWFGDEERKVTKRIQPITKEMMKEIREREKELNAKPIKKVLEAKARQRNKTQRLMNKINQKVAAVADNTTLTEFEKVRQIEQLYKTLRHKRNTREKMKLVVAKRSTAGKRAVRPKGLTGKYMQVDRRMLSDKRGEKNAAKRKKRKMKRKNK